MNPHYITTALASTLKFVGGPIAGFALGLSYLETVVCSSLGMMTTISVALFASKILEKLPPIFGKKKRRVFTKTKRFIVRIKLRFGLFGIAMLTPFLLSPAGGVAVALTFKFRKIAIFWQMLVASIIGGFIQAGVVYLLPTLKF